MSTPNLAIAHIASNQASKEVTANAGFDELSEALTNLLAHAMTDADYVLADNPPVSSEARYNMVYKFTGTLTATRNIIVPTGVQKLYIVSNQTTGGFDLIVKTLAGTGIRIPVSSELYAIVYADGTNVVGIATGTLQQIIGSDATFATEIAGYIVKGALWVASKNTDFGSPASIAGEFQSDGTTNASGVFGVAEVVAAASSSGKFSSGVEGDVIAAPASGQTIDEVAGVTTFAEKANTPGVITALSGLNVSANASNNPTSPDPNITNNIGVHVQAQSGVSANGNNAILIEDQGTADTDYAINILGGKSQLGGIGTAQKTVTGAYAATFSDHSIWADATGGAFAVTLPDATKASGGEILVKRISAANNVTVTPAGGQTIDGAATFVLTAQWKFVRLQSNGTNWMVVGSN